MPTEVILPKVDMDMQAGQISRWFFEEGATVKKGDVLFEIETDKAAMEVDAPADGILRDITGEEGVDIPVGRVVAWIFAEGEPYAALQGAAEEAVPALPLMNAGTRHIAAGEEIQPPRSTSATTKVRATPLARRIAKMAAIDITFLKGTGPGGRIGKADVQAAVAARDLLQERVPAAVSTGTGDESTLQLFEEGSYELVPHDSMRKTIARRLVEAKQTIPHFHLRISCRLDTLLVLRQQANNAARMRKSENGEDVPAYKISVNDFAIKALAEAFMDVPDANVSWTEANMVRHRHADIGVAVSVPGGLVTPIVRRAEEKRLSVISNEMRDLASRARSRKLRPEEYKGGTAAVSNLGMYGIEDFSAIINPPHAAILAVGAAEERPIICDGEVESAMMMNVTLAVDHRAIDGAIAAELLAAFKRHIENPLGMLI